MDADRDGPDAPRRRLDGVVWLWLAVNGIALMAGVNRLRDEPDAVRSEVLTAAAVGAGAALLIGLVGWLLIRRSASGEVGPRIGRAIGRAGPVVGLVVVLIARGQPLVPRFAIFAAALVLSDIVVFSDAAHRWSEPDDPGVSE